MFCYIYNWKLLLTRNKNYEQQIVDYKCKIGCKTKYKFTSEKKFVTIVLLSFNFASEKVWFMWKKY